MKASEVATKLTPTNRLYIDNNLYPDSETRPLITDDSLFVMQKANINLIKEVFNQNIILRLLSEKIEEITKEQSIAIKDNINALRFLHIISDFKALHFKSIFQVCPSVSNMKYTNVKNLFRITVAIHCRKLGLPGKCWFDNPFIQGHQTNKLSCWYIRENMMSRQPRALIIIPTSQPRLAPPLQ